MIVVSGYLQVNPSDRDTLLQDRQDSILRARAEQGCMEFTFAADSTDPGIIRVFEIWSSPEALEAHLDGRDRSAGSTSKVPIIARELTRYEIAASGPLRAL